MADLDDIKLEFELQSFDSPAFSFDDAYYLAHLSIQTYEKDHQRVNQRFADEIGECASVTPFSKGNTEGILIETDRNLIISYRGTESRADWAYNFKTKQVPSFFKFPGRVHEGFFEALNLVWASVIEPAIKNADTKGKKIFLTGHSLGGALCILTAARVAAIYDARLIDAIYTFGQPKVGNQEFVDFISDHYSDKYFRFVNHRDIVPLIPPSQMKYRHCGRLYHFDGEGELKENLQYESISNGPVLDIEDFERFKTEMLVDPKGILAEASPGYESLPPPARVFGIEDHSMTKKYLPLVRQQMEKEDEQST